MGQGWAMWDSEWGYVGQCGTISKTLKNTFQIQLALVYNSIGSYFEYDDTIY